MFFVNFDPVAPLHFPQIVLTNLFVRHFILWVVYTVDPGPMYQLILQPRSFQQFMADRMSLYAHRLPIDSQNKVLNYLDGSRNGGGAEDDDTK